MRILGTVMAGFPTPADEDHDNSITLDDWIIQNREASFMLAVRGDSMRDAGIFDGDMIVVERGVEPRIGQIIIAEIDGGWTMKYFRRGPRGVYLSAANPEYPDFYPNHDFKIAAVLRAVIRKYE